MARRRRPPLSAETQQAGLAIWSDVRMGSSRGTITQDSNARPSEEGDEGLLGLHLAWVRFYFRSGANIRNAPWGEHTAAVGGFADGRVQDY